MEGFRIPPPPPRGDWCLGGEAYRKSHMASGACNLGCWRWCGCIRGGGRFEDSGSTSLSPGLKRADFKLRSRHYAVPRFRRHRAIPAFCVRSPWFGTWVELMLWPTTSRPIRLGVGHSFGAHDQIFRFHFFCQTTVLLFGLGSPLWRQEGSVICSAICQWAESRRTHNHTLLFHLRLLSSLSAASYDSQGLRWKYSNRPPHGEVCYTYFNTKAASTVHKTMRGSHAPSYNYIFLPHPLTHTIDNIIRKFSNTVALFCISQAIFCVA
jgi:hypothetical protein